MEVSGTPGPKDKEKRPLENDEVTESAAHHKRRELSAQETVTHSATTNEENTTEGGHVKEADSSVNGHHNSLDDAQIDSSKLKPQTSDDTITKPIPSLGGFSGFSGSSAFGSVTSGGGFSSLLASSNVSAPSGFSSLLNSSKSTNIFSADLKDAATKQGEDADPEKTEPTNTEQVDEAQYVVVRGLEKTNVPTGEEGEVCVHLVRAKLYAIDPHNPDAGWKERGVGNLRILKAENNKTRLVMRADAVLRVILNLPLHSEYKVEDGGESMGDKTIRIFAIENGIGTWLAIRVGTKKSADELKEFILASMQALKGVNEKRKKAILPVEEVSALTPPRDISSSVQGVVEHSTDTRTGVEPSDSVEATEIQNKDLIDKEKDKSQP